MKVKKISFTLWNTSKRQQKWHCHVEFTTFWAFIWISSTHSHPNTQESLKVNYKSTAEKQIWLCCQNARGKKLYRVQIAPIRWIIQSIAVCRENEKKSKQWRKYSRKYVAIWYGRNYVEWSKKWERAVNVYCLFFFWLCICTAPGIIARNFTFSFQNTLQKQWTAVRVMKQASLLNTF